MILASVSSETIQAIAALWRLVAALTVLIVIIFLRKPLQQMFARLRNVRFKRGQAEVSIETLGGEAAATPELPAEEKKQEPPKPAQTEEPTPKEPGNLFFQMYSAFSDGKYEDADHAFENLQKAEEDAVKRLRSQATYHWLMYRHGRDAHAIQKLEELAKKDDVRETALYWVAACHEFSRSYAKAIDAYSRALSGQLEPADRSRHTVGLAKCYLKMGDTETGLKTLTSALQTVSDGEARSLLYRGIADVHETTGNTALRALALQKVLEFSPEDPKALFDAAYSQSAAKMSCLCATNYRTLLGFQPKHYSALNNLGVECDTLELPIKSVAFYKRAVEQGNSLAMSNLAYRYMNQGFETEAQSLLDTARKSDEPHENVGTAMANLAQKKQNENEALEQITISGVKQQEFFWAYADAYFVPSRTTAPFAGEWIAQSGRVFVVVQEGCILSGKWETDKAGEKFEGTTSNLGAQIKYQTKGGGLSLFPGAFWGASEDGFAFVSEDGTTIRIHTFDKRKAFFLTLKKKQQTHPTTP